MTDFVLSPRKQKAARIRAFSLLMGFIPPLPCDCLEPLHAPPEKRWAVFRFGAFTPTFSSTGYIVSCPFCNRAWWSR